MPGDVLGPLVGALVALAVAGAAVWKVRTTRDHQRRLLGTETTTTDVLRQLHQAATAAAGPGAYREQVELDGTAQPGPAGLLTSPVSGTACVWHAHKVTRHYRRETRDSQGRRRTEKRTEELVDERSREPFLLRDGGGEVLVVPTERVDGARKVVSEMREPTTERERTQISIGSFSLSLPSGSGDDTIGFEHEEWVVTPGTRLFVAGEAADRGGALEVRGPADPGSGGRLVLSTRSEDELLAGSRRESLLYTGGAVLAVVAAVALVVTALT